MAGIVRVPPLRTLFFGSSSVFLTHERVGLGSPPEMMHTSVTVCPGLATMGSSTSSLIVGEAETKMDSINLVSFKQRAYFFLLKEKLVREVSSLCGSNLTQTYILLYNVLLFTLSKCMREGKKIVCALKKFNMSEFSSPILFSVGVRRHCFINEDWMDYHCAHLNCQLWRIYTPGLYGLEMEIFLKKVSLKDLIHQADHKEQAAMGSVWAKNWAWTHHKDYSELRPVTKSE